MDFLEKLNYLMAENHLNKSTLSKACNIPYTTIDGWYKKGYEGLKLTTLRKLAEYFGTSLDYWASESNVLSHQTSQNKSLSEIHQKTLAQLEKMNDEQIKAVLAFINSLDELEKSLQPNTNNFEKWCRYTFVLAFFLFHLYITALPWIKISSAIKIFYFANVFIRLC